jgi:hypothetical protein
MSNDVASMSDYAAQRRRTLPALAGRGAGAGFTVICR